MNIAIIGIGYVGLVSGACFADFGHNVKCFDNNEERIRNLDSGIIPIFEPGLEKIVDKNVKSKRLSFSTNISGGLDEFDAIFIAVGTPVNQKDGSADLSAVFNVLNTIRETLKSNQLLVIKSTVPVGTNRKISRYYNIDQEKVVSNPEFLREGSAINDFMKPDRVVIGFSGEQTKRKMSEIYKPLYLRDFSIVFTDPESAELTKYASNAFLATKISFINEVAALCEKTGADIKEVAKGMGLDKRIGEKFLNAGPGYGGSCFPKDTLALTKTGQNQGIRLKITERVIEVNEDTKSRMVQKITNMFSFGIKDKILTILGVTFKPNTNDMRESASLTIIPNLVSQGAKIRIVDPQGKSEGMDHFSEAKWYDDPYLACIDANLVVLLTEWDEFRALELERMAKSMIEPRMADLRNIYSRAEALESGFIDYVGVGRGSI